MLFGYFTLIVALLIEVVGAYYSITGLAAIFSGAVIPILIMGGSLELGKVVAAVWLKNNWERAGIQYKLYLLPAVAMLMLITSMGIFGFLSKAHNDQNLVSGDVTSKIAIYDEKIKTEKENIEANRKALKQMDEGVDSVLGRSADEKGADKAVALRRSQQKERGRLQAEISQSQKLIAELNDSRAPIAAEVRKVEAEVGPIKYIAKLIYDDNPDANILEKAVVWVIMIIVAVFDPLALVLILAAQQSIRWAQEEKRNKDNKPISDIWPFPDAGIPAYEADDGPLTEDQIEQIQASADPHPPGWMFEDNHIPELFRQEVPDDPIPCYKCGTPMADVPGIGLFCPNQLCDVIDTVPDTVPDTDPVAIEPDLHVYDDERLVTNMDKQQLAEEPTVTALNEEYIEVNGKRMHHKVFDPKSTDAAHAFERHTESLQPAPVVEYEFLDEFHEPEPVIESATKNDGNLWLPQPDGSWRNAGPVDQFGLGLAADNSPASATGEMRGFGVSFPQNSSKGDMFLRVDQLPSVLYKFNGTNWIEVDKKLSDQYLYDEAYIDHLIEKIGTGEYDPDLLSDAERESIEKRLIQKA